MNLLTLLHQSVSKHGEKECLRYKDGEQYHSITYDGFWESIQAFALGLRELGVKEGEKVGILSANCPAWAISDFAIMWIGAIVVPIYHTLPPSQVEFILSNADVEYLLVENESQYNKIVQNWPPQLKFVVCFNRSAAMQRNQVRSFNDVIELGRKQQGTNGLPDIYSIQPYQMATIVHTSGTSGSPKGVMLTHQNIVSNVQSSLTYLPVYPSDVGLSYLPLSHIFERTVGQFAALASGAAIAYAESIEKIQQNLKEVQPTIFCTVPRLLEKVYAGVRQKTKKVARIPLISQLINRLVKRKLREGLGGRIRLIVSGGAGLAADIAEFFTNAGIPVYEGYGMTEAAPVICANPLNASRAGSVGLPIPGVQVRVSDDGELLVQGPNVMQGYYKDPVSTEEAFTSDGWLRTGDIAAFEEGYVKIVDRKKNILVLATGKNVAPWPIENSIALSPFISEALLIGDNRNYVTVLLVPEFPALEAYAAEKKLGDSRAEWLASSEIRELLRQEVIQATEKFAGFERPKRAVLLHEELTMEAGDLTPTLKIRNKIILQKYGGLIEAMYAGTEYLPIFDNAVDEEPANQAASQKAGSPLWKYAVAGAAAGILVRIWIGA